MISIRHKLTHIQTDMPGNVKPLTPWVMNSDIYLKLTHSCTDRPALQFEIIGTMSDR